ncbi:MAG: helix-turn-helix transcriptional regulator [Oscillospiraceae bacterium]|nr:helix-turn-helix transcriptional regulator [Oscillospiraceae bacterium]
MDGFGKRLVAAREKKGLSQKKLAELLNITPTRLNYWEKDKREPDFFMFSEILKILDADANELLGLRRQLWNDSDKKLITAYREHPDMQPAINKMLDIDNEPRYVWRAARSENHTPPQIIEMSAEELDILENAPGVTSDDDL